jgi:hypothetical protein
MNIRNILPPTRSCILLLVLAALAACGGGGGGGGGDGNSSPTGTLTATIVDEFGTPVAGAGVAVTVGTTSLSDTTNAAGVATVASLPPGAADIAISLNAFQTRTATATIVAGETTPLDIQLIRNRQAAGGVLTTSVVGAPTDNGKVLTIELQVVVVDQGSQPIVTLTAGDFTLSACSPTDPDPDPGVPECVRYPENAQTDSPYTVDNAIVDAFALVPGGAPTDYAAALMLDQSGSIGDTDPTNARLFSAKAFVQTVNAGSGDSVLLTAFAGPGHAPRIPTSPLWFGGTFTTDGTSYFDELDALGDQAGGDTPLYRVLFPEPTDPKNDPGFNEGLIDYTAANSPAGLRKAIVIFTDGDDNECISNSNCNAKRQRVIDSANAASISLFTIGLSNSVNFEALAELARETDGVFLFAEHPEQLIPLYGSLGALLSRSLPTYTMRWTVRADMDSTFVSGHSLLGRLQVNGGGSPVTVPFMVGIP